MADDREVDAVDPRAERGKPEYEGDEAGERKGEDERVGGEVEARPQPEEGISLAPKTSVEEAEVVWTEPAWAVDRRIRACTPAPGAWTTLAGERVKLGPVRLDPGVSAAPGVLVVSKNAVHVGTGTHAVRLGELKAFGKKQMAAADWARGVRLDPDARFGA